MKLKWIMAIVVIFGLLTMFYILQWPTVLKTTLILFSIVLIGFVLLQSGKGGGLAAIGGLSDQTAMGTKTSTVLSKLTYLVGASFIFTTILLTKLTLSSIHGTGTFGKELSGMLQETTQIHEEHDGHDHEGHDHEGHDHADHAGHDHGVEGDVEEAGSPMGMKAVNVTEEKHGNLGKETAPRVQEEK